MTKNIITGILLIQLVQLVSFVSSFNYTSNEVINNYTEVHNPKPPEIDEKAIILITTFGVIFMCLICFCLFRDYIYNNCCYCNRRYTEIGNQPREVIRNNPTV